MFGLQRAGSPSLAAGWRKRAPDPQATPAFATLRSALPPALPHQADLIAHDARFKLWRAGRRTGKTRGALRCAIHGHGSRGQHKGLLQGKDVAWIAPDYPQSKLIWNEDIRPRFKGVSGITLNETERTLSIEGGGTLHIRSAEVIDGIRGIGKNLGGVIGDEAAHFDLEYAHKNVIRPALMDNKGWALYQSTTNAGLDGNAEQRTPSYFNLLCEEIREGKRDADWAEFYGTAYDNTSLDPAEVDQLVGEYVAGSVGLEQEIYAKLLRAGVGAALEEITAETHLVPPFRIPADWEEWGAFDWGYWHPWSFGHFARSPNGERTVLVDSCTDRKQLPDAIIAAVQLAMPIRQMVTVCAGHDIWDDLKARGQKGDTIARKFLLAKIPVRKARISRIAGLNNLRAYASVKHGMPDDRGGPNTPRFQMMDTPANRLVLATLERMQVDPDKPEDALKVDANPSTGAGGDDAYDMVRYGLMHKPIVTVAPAPVDRDTPQDRHPGLDDEGVTQSRHRRPASDDSAPRTPHWAILGDDA